MAVHVLDAADSDGESWMEVLEGSPGPSVRNSRASSFCAAAQHTNAPECAADEDENDDDDKSWVCDFEGSNDTNAHGDTGVAAPPCTTNDEPDSDSDDKTPDHDQSPCLERPELGDMRNHYLEVLDLSRETPDKAVYYQSWLCWMYRMKLSEIQYIIHRGPYFIIEVVNHLFGLRNHPSWKADNNKNWGSLGMELTCIDIFTWWDKKWRPQTDQDDGVGLSSVQITNSHSPHSSPYDQIITLQVKPARYPTPSTLGDVLKCLDRDYKSVNGRYPYEDGQPAISFQTWVQWQQSCPSSSPQPWSIYDNKNDIVYAFIKSMGLPFEAARDYDLFMELHKGDFDMNAPLSPLFSW